MRLLFVLLFICSTAHAQTISGNSPQVNGYIGPYLCNTSYYVNSALGNDSNTGTGPGAGAAWASSTKVNSSTFTADNCVLFQSGQTFGAVVVPSNNITIGSYGTAGRATISAGTATGISSTNQGGITIRDLVIQGNGLGTTNRGVYFENNQAGNVHLVGPVLYNLDVSGFGSSGVYIVGGTNASQTATSGYDDVLISYVTSHGNTFGDTTYDNNTSGIQIGPSYWTWGNGVNPPAFLRPRIVHSTSFNNSGANNPNNTTGSGFFIGSCSQGVIEYSVASNNGTAANGFPTGPVGAFMYNCSNCVMQYNEVSNQSSGAIGIDGEGYDLDAGSQNCVMQYNYSRNSSGQGYLLYSYVDAQNGDAFNNTVRFNISENDGTQADRAQYPLAGIGIYNDKVMTGVRVYGNTIYNAVIRAIGIGGSLSASITGTIANNIFSVTGTRPLVTTVGNPSITFVNNDYFTTGASASLFTWNSANYASLVLWQMNTGQDSVGLSSNPLLTSPGTGGTCGNRNFSTTTCPSGYTLQGGSPMLSVGIDLTQAPYSLSVGSQDYYGNPIPTGVGTGYNIGAY